MNVRSGETALVYLANYGIGMLIMAVAAPRGWTGLSFAFLALMGLGLAWLVCLALPERRWGPGGIQIFVLAYAAIVAGGYSVIFLPLLHRQDCRRVAITAPLFLTAAAFAAQWLDQQISYRMTGPASKGKNKAK